MFEANGESEQYELFLNFIGIDTPSLYKRTMGMLQEESSPVPKNQQKEISQVDFNAKIKQELDKR